ncbi:THUMP domain-containing protein, partial [Thermoproteota archaeon]
MGLVICRYGEIALKGQNRGMFESMLVGNIERALKAHKLDAKVKRLRGRVFVYSNNIGGLVKCLKKVFGLVSVSPAVECGLDMKKIKKTVLDLLKDKQFETFRITTRRPNKKFELNSNEVDVDVGAFIVSELDKTVKLKDQDLDVGIEIHDAAYIFTEKVDGPGGLPVGMSGNVLCFVEDEKDLLAAWLMMKRGCKVFLAGTADIDT